MKEPQQPAAAPSDSRAVTEQSNAPPTIDSHGGKLTPMGADPLTIFAGMILLLSPVAALMYGFGHSAKPPSAAKIAIKTLAVGMMAVLVFFNLAMEWQSAPPVWRLGWLLLGTGYLLCAVGDAFLAGDPKRWLTPGLVAFLLGHLVFIALFATSTGTREASPLVYLAMAAVTLTGAAMLAWLWPDLGTMRWPVVAYVLVIVTMVCVSLPHWRHNIAWPIGALMFMASDAILAGELFKGARLFRSGRLTAWAIWFLYYAAQVAFLAGMIGYAAKV